MDWYYIDESVTDGDRRKGPFSDEEIEEMVAKKEIHADTLVWHNGEENWRPWKEFEAEFEKSKTDEIIQQTLEALIRDKEIKENLPKPYAGFWIRTLAYGIDFVILSFMASAILYVMNICGFIDMAQANEILGQNIENITDFQKMNAFVNVKGVQAFIVVCSILQALYSIIFNALFSGTPGKIFLKLKIIKKGGKPLGFKGAVVRYACTLISSVSLVYLYGFAYVIALVDPEKRTLHDWLARTRVIKIK